MQHKQRAEDLEEELQLIQKHLKSTQTKVAEQVNVCRLGCFAG